MVYSSLQENRPKLKTANRAVYARCAQLILALERCIFYGGATSASSLSALNAPGGVNASDQSVNDLMKECLQIANTVHAEGDELEQTTKIGMRGKLRKKGGGHSRFGRHSWHERYFEVHDPIVEARAPQAPPRMRTP